MTTYNKAHLLIAHYMEIIVTVEIESVKKDAQKFIDKLNDFIENPNVTTTSSEVNKIYFIVSNNWK